MIYLPMVGFEPWISGVGIDRSANWATTTPYIKFNYKLAFWLFLSTIRLVHPKLHSSEYLNGKIKVLHLLKGSVVLFLH